MKIVFKATFNCIAEFPEIEEGDTLKKEEAILSIKEDFMLRMVFKNQLDLHQVKSLEYNLLPHITDIEARE